MSSSASTKHELPKLWTAINDVLDYSNKLEKVIRIIAKLIVMWRMRAAGLTPSSNNLEDPVADDLKAAEKLLLLTAMPATYSAFADGKLLSLNPEKLGSLVVTRGRFGEKSLSRLLGVPYLPILMPDTRTAFLHMVRAHEGEHGSTHGSIVTTLARSREKVWIILARDLAKRVVSQCPCAKEIKRSCRLSAWELSKKKV